ncbi:MAG: 4-hydroxy-3-methylbut-2-enyl diphosphate reductase [Victivallales bacterium]|nr:4-hydroxy-3-methylbut-2-enyl diphosphate reductase [Victivallales bacterium]
MANGEKHLFLVKPLGFCGGVRHALELFDKIAAQNPDEQIYVFQELVHNRLVTDAMRKRNAFFVESIDAIPPNAITLFGAHGVSTAVEEEARKRNLRCYDAVCPLVLRLQQNAVSAPENLPLILFGDRQHPEIKSVLGRTSSRQVFVLEKLEDVEKLPSMEEALFLCQTTRNQQEVRQLAALLKKRIPHLHDKASVCEAVALRQTAIAELAPKCDLMLVVSSPHSSNGRRMLAIAQEKCHCAALVEDEEDLCEKMLEGVCNVGVSSATSTPDCAINAVIAKLEALGYVR